MKDRTIDYRLFVDGELVGDGAVWLDGLNRVKGAGGPLGYINMVCMGPFEDLFNGYVKTVDTGRTSTFGGEVVQSVDVYTLTYPKWVEFMRERAGGYQPPALPFWEVKP